MAELSGAGPDGAAPDDGADATESALRARIAELEALVEARRLTIVGLAAQLAEFQGSPTFARGRLAEAERHLAALEATKVIRYSAIPRRAYTKLRRAAAGCATMAEPAMPVDELAAAVVDAGEQEQRLRAQLLARCRGVRPTGRTPGCRPTRVSPIQLMPTATGSIWQTGGTERPPAGWSRSLCGRRTREARFVRTRWLAGLGGIVDAGRRHGGGRPDRPRRPVAAAGRLASGQPVDHRRLRLRRARQPVGLQRRGRRAPVPGRRLRRSHADRLRDQPRQWRAQRHRRRRRWGGAPRAQLGQHARLGPRRSEPPRRRRRATAS